MSAVLRPRTAEERAEFFCAQMHLLQAEMRALRRTNEALHKCLTHTRDYLRDTGATTAAAEVARVLELTEPTT